MLTPTWNPSPLSSCQQGGARFLIHHPTFDPCSKTGNYIRSERKAFRQAHQRSTPLLPVARRETLRRRILRPERVRQSRAYSRGGGGGDGCRNLEGGGREFTRRVARFPNPQVRGPGPLRGDVDSCRRGTVGKLRIGKGSRPAPRKRRHGQPSRRRVVVPALSSRLCGRVPLSLRLQPYMEARSRLVSPGSLPFFSFLFRLEGSFWPNPPAVTS